jgi:hypothetical protein
MPRRFENGIDVRGRLILSGSALQQVLTIAPSAGVYTIDVLAGNEFEASAAINGATTVNLSNLASLPSGYRWTGVLDFAYTSGTISWFTGNAGFTARWDRNTTLVPTAGETESVIIRVIGGRSVIRIAALGGGTT